MDRASRRRSAEIRGVAKLTGRGISMKTSLASMRWSGGLCASIALMWVPSAPAVDGSWASTAHDPGARSALGAAGGQLAILTPAEQNAHVVGKAEFSEPEDVRDGLGPPMNVDSCSGCHSQPAIGGSSPPINPQVAFAQRAGARNTVPSFLRSNGPIREARFVRNADGTLDGGVHALFTIAGRADASECAVAQPDFAAAQAQGNVVFRIPTPLFGAGLIEQIPDSEILAQIGSASSTKNALGIRGHGNVQPASATISAQPNKNGNDGTLGRFGWKAQNKSLLVFSGEAYNVEMGITNGAFPTERDETDACNVATVPNSDATLDGATPAAVLSSIERFTLFMR